MQVNIKNLIDDVQCYQTVRELRWPDGVWCPSCKSWHTIKHGFDKRGFDDLTDMIFAGHHRLRPKEEAKTWHNR